MLLLFTYLLATVLLQSNATHFFFFLLHLSNCFIQIKLFFSHSLMTTTISYCSSPTYSLLLHFLCNKFIHRRHNLNLSALPHLSSICHHHVLFSVEIEIHKVISSPFKCKNTPPLSPLFGALFTANHFLSYFVFIINSICIHVILLFFILFCLNSGSISYRSD